MEEKVATLILYNGTGTGIIECTLDEWYGISYKIPRSKMKELKNLKYIHNSGVYLLIGEDEETADKIVYVGEAEDIEIRIEQHKEDYWNECIVFMSKDNSLNKAHIKYIENSLYNEAKSIGRYKLKNSVNPTKSSLSTADELTAKKFADKVKIITSIFGYRIFDKL